MDQEGESSGCMLRIRVMGRCWVAEEVKKAGESRGGTEAEPRGAKKCLTLIKTWARNGGARNTVHWLSGMITQSHSHQLQVHLFP